MKKMNALNKRIVTLINLGIARELWTSMRSASLVLRMSSNALNNHCSGRTHEDGLLKKTIQKLEKALQGTSEEYKGNACKRLFLVGCEKGLWRTREECAKAISVDPGSFSNILIGENDPTQGPQARYFKNVKSKLDARVRAVGDGNKRKRRRSQRPAEAIRSTWFDELLAGGIELRGQTFDNNRFVVRRESFLTLQEGTFNDREIENTIVLLTELRRRFVIISQLGDEERRRVYQSGIGREVDLLLQMIELARQVVPTYYLAHLEEALEKIRNFNPGRRK